jgi:ABC-type glutathione transport system ATPase component
METNLSESDFSDVLPVHASAASINGDAFIFLGSSGSGKSTICRLLSPHFLPLADDAVYLVPREKDWLVADATAKRGTPASFSQMPMLKAMFLLHQDTTVRFQKSTELDCCYRLVNALFETSLHHKYNDTNKRKQAFEKLTHIARSIPSYHLYFDLSANFVGLFISFLK